MIGVAREDAPRTAARVTADSDIRECLRVFDAPDVGFGVACARAEDFLDALPVGRVSLIFFDGPYYGEKTEEEWDTAWGSAAEFLAWQGAMLARFRRVLAPNGSIYVCASPRMGSRVEVNVAEHFSVLTNIRWRKGSGWHNGSHKEGLRAPFPASETIVFAEQYGADAAAMADAQYDAKCDELRGFVFEPIRAYLDGERVRAGFDRKACDAACGNQMFGHYFSRVQWALPTLANYEKLRAAFNATGGEYLRREYEDLRREYEDLRREYEDLRRPFFLSPDVPYTDVWDFPTVANYPGKHRCEKPEEMMEHIISTSSRPGDIVLDATCGSGAFLAVAVRLGRRAVGCDMDQHWADATRRRCEMARTTGNSRVRKVERRNPKQRSIFDVLAEGAGAPTEAR